MATYTETTWNETVGVTPTRLNNIESGVKYAYNNAIPYVTTAGVANTYTLTLSPAPTVYVDGMPIAVKINIANTSTSTINVNGLGAKTILDSKGNALTSGKLKVGIVYTLRYNGTNFILQGDGGSGNAVASDLLSGKTASVDAGDIVGTMVNRGHYETSTAIHNQVVAIPQGYHDGTGYIWYWDANHIPSNIKKNANVGGVIGTYETPLSSLVLFAGDSVIYTDPTIVVKTPVGTEELYGNTYQVQNAGTYRCRITAKRLNSGSRVLSILVNGVNQFTYGLGSIPEDIYTIMGGDVTIPAGGTVQFVAFYGNGSSGGNTISMKDFSIGISPMFNVTKL